MTESAAAMRHMGGGRSKLAGLVPVRRIRIGVGSTDRCSSASHFSDCSQHAHWSVPIGVALKRTEGAATGYTPKPEAAKPYTSLVACQTHMLRTSGIY